MESKKMKKLLLSCGLVGVMGVGASLAYFSDVTDILKNTFSLYGSGEGQHAIELKVKESAVKQKENSHNYIKDETKPVIYDSVEGTANNYINLLPGSEVYKDPTVEVQANTLESVIVVRIENYKQNSFEITGSNIGTGTNQWTELTEYKDLNDGNVTFFKYNSTVDTMDGQIDNLTLFTGLKIKSSGIDEKKTKILDMIISAAAVQTENNTVEKATLQAVQELGGEKVIQ